MSRVVNGNSEGGIKRAPKETSGAKAAPGNVGFDTQRQQTERWPTYSGALRPVGYPTFEPKIEDLMFGDTMSLDNAGYDRLKVRLRDSSFREEYPLYRERIMGSQETGYRQLVDGMARDLVKKMKETGGLPTAFVAIPSRREPHTSRAVEAIAADFLDSNSHERLFFFVLHNDIDQPTPETMSDLVTVRGRNDSIVADLQFGPENNIGDARAIMTDAIMEACFQMGVENIPPLIQADSDLTKIGVPGSVRALVEPLQREKDIAAVVAKNVVDLDTVKADKAFGLRTEVVQLLSTELSQLGKDVTYSTINGAFSALNLLALMKLGGVPRVRMGEDLLLSNTIRTLFGRSTVVALPMQQAYVAVDGSRSVTAEIRGDKSRYEHWQEGADIMREAVVQAPLKDSTSVLDRISRNYEDALSSGLGIRKEPAKEQIIAICKKYGLDVTYNDESRRFEQIVS